MTSSFRHSSLDIRHSSSAGIITLYVILFSAFGIIVLSGLVVWADTNARATFRDFDRAQAFAIAESGIEYYRWHLGADVDDYQDGTASAGPYVHEFLNKDGATLGAFSLEITSPSYDATVLGIDSTGTVTSDPSVSRTIETTMAIPSFAKYAAIVGGFLWYPPGSEIFGPVHSNAGVRVDGFAHNLVTSAVATYNDPTHGGGSAEFGVHTHTAPVDPQPPAAVPDRPDVFGAGRTFPVSPIDFVALTHNLSEIKASAQADGLYLPKPTGSVVGYHAELLPNDTVNVYNVTKVLKAPNNCTAVHGEHQWGTWTIEQESLLGNYPLPSNGLLFFEADVWVDGTVDGQRITIGAAEFPEQNNQNRNIIVNEDLRYTYVDGTDSIGLIAQQSIIVGLHSNDTLRIDGALVAQNGQVGRYYYKGPQSAQNRGCEPYHVRAQLTLFGLLAAQNTYGFVYEDGTGYQDITVIYDANMLWAPPPKFPRVSDYYTIIDWNER